MRKKITLVLTAAVIGTAALTAAGCSSKTAQESTAETSVQESTEAAAEETEESEETEDAIGMPNPWTDSDKEGVLAATGFEMNPPEGATDVHYYYMAEDKLAQMDYSLDDKIWVYRMQAADEFTDISGMYYDWADVADDKVLGMDAKSYSYVGGEYEDDVQVINWYDAVPGVMYSLSAMGTDLDGMDIQVYAEQIYESLQGDATDDPAADRENELKTYFLGEHVNSDDGSSLTITDKNDGTFDISIIITRLCNMDEGVGTFEDHKMKFDIMDSSGNPMSGIIYRDSDNSLTVKITDSTWDYLPNDTVIEGFGK